MAITGAATGSVKAGTSAFERVDLLLTPAPLLVRLFILVLGVMAFSNEYRYGTIIPSLSGLRSVGSSSARSSSCWEPSACFWERS